MTDKIEISKWDEVNKRMSNYFTAIKIDKQALISRRRLELMDLRITLNKDVIEIISFLDKALPEDQSYDPFYNMDLRKKRGCFAIVLPEYNFF